MTVGVGFAIALFASASSPSPLESSAFDALRQRFGDAIEHEAAPAPVLRYRPDNMYEAFKGAQLASKSDLEEARSSEGVDLRPLDSRTDLPLLERWLRSAHVARWWETRDLQVSLLAQRSRDTDAVIISNREPVGYLCWQTLSPSELVDAGLADLPEGLVDIDILIGEPEYLGRGIGPRALALVLEKLRGEGVIFAGLGTSTSNRAAIRAFEKAGFRAFRDFDDPEFGRCRYMVVRVEGVKRP